MATQYTPEFTNVLNSDQNENNKTENYPNIPSFESCHVEHVSGMCRSESTASTNIYPHW